MKVSLFFDICKQNYLALIQMIEQAINLCPESLWSNQSYQPQFWQEIYHTIYYLDFYLGTNPKKHKEQFEIKENLSEIPETILTKTELVDYLKDVKKKTEDIFNKLKNAEIEGKNSFWWTGETLGHKLVYNLRHSQHHMGKINFILRTNDIEPSKWIIKPKGWKKKTHNKN
jgi:hypothetical protein